jgi:hypothetical protein
MALAIRNFHDLTPGKHEGAVLRTGGNSQDHSRFIDAARLSPFCSYNATNVVLYRK